MKSVGQLLLSLFLVWGAEMAVAGLPVVDPQGQVLPSLAPLIDKVAPAVVNISSFKSANTASNQLLPRADGVGSGVIVDSEQGLVLSNHHVIANSDEIRITLADGRSFKALLIGSDPGVDLALLKIEADNLVALELVDSEQLRVGDFVVAIGNPFGLGQTVTSGIVSALERTGLGIESYENFIQTDAAINPGNSGGALINLQGQLVGINTAIVAPKGSSVGIGFAIPSSMAKTIAQHLAQDGEVSRGTLGVSIQELTPALLKALKAPKRQGGVLVTAVAGGSAADKVGIVAGDIIVAINERPLEDVPDLRSRLGLLTLNAELTIEFLRKGETHQVRAQIRDAAKKSDTEAKKERVLQFSGVLLRDAGAKPGVEVRSINDNSPVAAAGIKKGDLILSVNQQPTDTLEAFAEAMSDGSNLLLVQRGMRRLFVVLE